jgi:lactate dehydrogenase-like 2-hydroxyacid dehydrogenase
MIGEICQVDLWEDKLPPPRETILRGAENCDGLLCLLSDNIDAEAMDSLPKLRVISQYAVGVDNIDLDAATARGIPVGHTPGVLTEATADLAFGLLMAAGRRIAEGVENVKAGDWHTWTPLGFLGADVWGAKLGIIGLGRIGAAMARRGRGFSMQVIYNDPVHRPKLESELGITYAPLAELLAKADFVSLHCPLTLDTHHLIDKAALQQMKPSAVLVNTSRGPVVNTDSLVTALEDGWIAAAALDVTDPEPIPAGHRLLSLANCTIVPHIGSATTTARDRMAVMAAENLLAGLEDNRLPYCANSKVYDI